MTIPLGPVETFLWQAKQEKRKLLSIVVDPDKAEAEDLERLSKLWLREPDIWLCGGSLLTTGRISSAVKNIRAVSTSPVLLFPGDTTQITDGADGLLLLSLISGRNAELLIGQHVRASFALQRSQLELLPCGYLVVDGGRANSVSYMSNTSPIPADKPDIAAATALAGQQLGLRHMYLEAGSGALKPISTKMISRVKKLTNIVLWVGGGIRSVEEAQMALDAGADILVVGTAIENHPEFMQELQRIFVPK